MPRLDLNLSALNQQRQAYAALQSQQLALDTTLAAQQAARPKQPPAKAESCSIEGQVVNAVTGEPLTKATIDLWPVANGQELRYDAVTTAGGRFVIRDIESGQYRMRDPRATPGRNAARRRGSR